MRQVSIDPGKLNLSTSQRQSLARGVLEDAVIQSLRSALSALHALALQIPSRQLQSYSEDDQTVIEIPLFIEHVLAGEEWGVADGLVLDIPGTIRLLIDRLGDPQEIVCDLPDVEDIRSAVSHVRSLIAREEIAPAGPFPLPPRGLMTQGTPYYIALDQSGRKRLQRAFVSTSLP